MKIYVRDFDLKKSIESGQFFRYEKDDNKYIVILKDRIVSLYQEDDCIFVDSNNMDNIENLIIDFFSLNVDYSIINNKIINKDKGFKQIVEISKGYRILKMEPLETIISYIISANNSVNNIKKCVDRISNKFGSKIFFNNKEYNLFPTIDQLKGITLTDLIDMKLGFRAKYVKLIIDKIINKEFDIENISNMKTEKALDYLMKENGIGLKVASCILLFAYSKYDVFPIDVWVKKIMKEKYNIDKDKEIKEYIQNTYGEYSGIVIQYLFNYKRNII